MLITGYAFYGASSNRLRSGPSAVRRRPPVGSISQSSTTPRPLLYFDPVIECRLRVLSLLAFIVFLPPALLRGQAPAEVQVTPAQLQLKVAARERLFLSAYDADGNLLANPAFTFAVAQASVARIEADGTVVGLAPGSTSHRNTIGHRPRNGDSHGHGSGAERRTAGSAPGQAGTGGATGAAGRRAPHPDPGVGTTPAARDRRAVGGSPWFRWLRARACPCDLDGRTGRTRRR